VTLPSPAALRNPRIGNDAGWLLAFHRELPTGGVLEVPELWFGCDDYHAEIQATLPGGLEGGVYTFKIERLASAEYQRLAEMSAGKRALGVVKLYLFWRDALAGVTDYLAGMVGLGGLGDITPFTTGTDPVAVLSVTDVSRANGTRGIETTIKCRERIFQHLSNYPLCGLGVGIDTTSLDTAITTTLQRLGMTGQSVVHALTPNPGCAALPVTAPGGNRQQLRHGTLGTRCMTLLAGRMEEQTRRHGRGMLLIRTGTLHVGPRPIPLIPSDGVKDLSAETGLADAPQALEPLVTDPTFDRCTNPVASPPTRAQYKLICKGRPDLRPGDVVRFSVPKEEASAGFGGVIGLVADLAGGPLLPELGGVAEPSMRLYVNSVDHKLGRTTGFVTTVTGVELTDGQSDWDCHTPASKPEKRQSQQPETAGAETEAARAVKDVTEEALALQAQVEAGELRGSTTTAGQLPAQTLQVWRGLEQGDGNANQAARLGVARPSPAPASGAPYLTPFAFGKAGLVLPNYPGTRLAVAHRLGNPDDPLVAGAFWHAGDAPASQVGDWWLILPTEVQANGQQPLADTDTSAPTAYTGKASDDLTDASGNRIIEVGELTIRVGSAALQPAGTRPTRATDQQSVTIEHADGGSKIVMESGGKIRIETGADLEIKAANVKFTVTGTVDVA
jgi:hypothetical protein